jgi:hypothetical protein
VSPARRAKDCDIRAMSCRGCNRQKPLGFSIVTRADLALITWLASYPRSGNTLLRVILKQCFGLSSQSIHDDAELDTPGVREAIGFEAVGNDPRRFIDDARREARSLYVKTLELPGGDAHPAIYVVRDGRSSVVSYRHYLHGILGRDTCLSDVIRGELAPSWSEHVEAWALSDRPNTLVVRYEQLAAADPRALQQIAAFLDRPLLQAFDTSFERLHALNPQFFRRGSDAANIAEMDAVSLRLFEQLHGATLRRIGYGALPTAATRLSTLPANNFLPR